MNLCEICGSNYLIQEHHIVSGRGKRKQHENEHSVIFLCWNCHHGTYGVHGREGHKLDIQLKRELQEKYINMGYAEDKARELMGGRLY